MASSTTSNDDIHVMEDDINNGGRGEGVITELQELRELKMMRAGANLGPIHMSAAQQGGAGGGSPISVSGPNVRCEGTEECETPTADFLFPTTPLQTPMLGTALLPGILQIPGTAQTLVTVTDGCSMHNIPMGGTSIPTNEHFSINGSDGVPAMRAGLRRPYMPPPSALIHQNTPLDVNVAYGEGLEEGTHHQPTEQNFFQMPSEMQKQEGFPHAGRYIPQLDGPGPGPGDEENFTELCRSYNSFLKAYDTMKINMFKSTNKDSNKAKMLRKASLDLEYVTHRLLQYNDVEVSHFNEFQAILNLKKKIGNGASG